MPIIIDSKNYSFFCFDKRIQCLPQFIDNNVIQSYQFTSDWNPEPFLILMTHRHKKLWDSVQKGYIKATDSIKDIFLMYKIAAYFDIIFKVYHVSSNDSEYTTDIIPYHSKKNPDIELLEKNNQFFWVRKRFLKTSTKEIHVEDNTLVTLVEPTMESVKRFKPSGFSDEKYLSILKDDGYNTIIKMTHKKEIQNIESYGIPKDFAIALFKYTELNPKCKIILRTVFNLDGIYTVLNHEEYLGMAHNGDECYTFYLVDGKIWFQLSKKTVNQIESKKETKPNSVQSFNHRPVRSARPFSRRSIHRIMSRRSRKHKDINRIIGFSSDDEDED